MELCEECGHKNPEGALICENCSALLFSRDPEAPTEMLDDQPQPASAAPTAARGTSTFAEGMRLILQYTDSEGATSQVVVVDDEITLGRVDEHTSFLPDVNLSRMAAWEKGVSRLHAAIRRSENNLYLIDLASTNGTFLNGERIPAREPQLLHHNDTVRLGLFEMRLSFTPEG
jgi:pSer/pThr/pTyr-binding forkhead associated (FHA) protein